MADENLDSKYTNGDMGTRVGRLETYMSELSANQVSMQQAIKTSRDDMRNGMEALHKDIREITREFSDKFERLQGGHAEKIEELQKGQRPASSTMIGIVTTVSLFVSAAFAITSGMINAGDQGSREQTVNLEKTLLSEQNDMEIALADIKTRLDSVDLHMTEHVEREGHPVSVKAFDTLSEDQKRIEARMEKITNENKGEIDRVERSFVDNLNSDNVRIEARMEKITNENRAFGETGRSALESKIDRKFDLFREHEAKHGHPVAWTQSLENADGIKELSAALETGLKSQDEVLQREMRILDDRTNAEIKLMSDAISGSIEGLRSEVFRLRDRFEVLERGAIEQSARVQILTTGLNEERSSGTVAMESMAENVQGLIDWTIEHEAKSSAVDARQDESIRSIFESIERIAERLDRIGD